MDDLFHSDDVEAVVFIDTSNAFNSLNRQAALRSIHSLCPSLSIIAINSYRQNIDLFIDNQSIQSCEGATQGDPLAPVIYAITLMPLIQKFQAAVEAIHQIWYADDASAAGNLKDVKSYIDLITDQGPAFGYNINMKKTWLLVKDQRLQSATDMFGDCNINITSLACKYLGATIGPSASSEALVQDKIATWVNSITTLAEIAQSHPHAAYSAFCMDFSISGHSSLGLSLTLPTCLCHLKKSSDTT